MRAQPLRGEFAARQPGVGGDHAVVGEHVDGGEADCDFARGLGVGRFVVDDGDDELQDAADEETGHEEHAAVAVANDDAGVGDEGEDADGG